MGPAQVGGGGKDHYADHDCPVSPGYRGESDPRRIFERSDLTKALSHRFISMTRHVTQFKALAAIELFNEPNFKLTHTDVFWSATHAFRLAIGEAVANSANTPLYSGVAAWDKGIIAAARRQGDFDDEPVVTVHDYEDFTLPGKQAASNSQMLISYLRRIAPGKPLVLSEFGSRRSLPSSDQHRAMVDASYTLYRDNAIGLWVWGTYFPQPNEVDYKWDFNHRSPAGLAYRVYAFDADEDQFATGGRVIITHSGPDVGGNPGVWELTLDGKRFDGLSRSGVFPKYSIELGPKTLSTAAETYFLGHDFSSWIVVRADPTSSAHELTEYQCAPQGPVETPPQLLGLSVDAQYLTWTNKRNCLRSRMVINFRL